MFSPGWPDSINDIVSGLRFQQMVTLDASEEPYNLNHTLCASIAQWESVQLVIGRSGVRSFMETKFSATNQIQKNSCYYHSIYHAS